MEDSMLLAANNSLDRKTQYLITQDINLLYSQTAFFSICFSITHIGLILALATGPVHNKAEQRPSCGLGLSLSNCISYPLKLFCLQHDHHQPLISYWYHSRRLDLLCVVSRMDAQICFQMWADKTCLPHKQTFSNSVPICLINRSLSRHTKVGVTISCVKSHGLMRSTLCDVGR